MRSAERLESGTRQLECTHSELVGVCEYTAHMGNLALGAVCGHSACFAVICLEWLEALYPTNQRNLLCR